MMGSGLGEAVTLVPDDNRADTATLAHSAFVPVLPYLFEIQPNIAFVAWLVSRLKPGDFNYRRLP
ncbi:hypothetical protein ASD02_26240 [Ensifer sp. Root1252]|nr:hypothetical protein ASD02_26240 [Ensifer sp. Root1252]KQY73147.1 hypothetical protein ASD52_28675 [Ensifer sp. Root142]